MEKKIEDYMHLYLRCPERIVKCIKSNYYFVHEMYIHKGDEFVLMPHLLAAFLLHGKRCDWKLILRPLSDMTEEEMLAAGKYQYPNLPSFKVEMKDNLIRPEVARYLLSKGFDLFGLIDAGLAIDKTKLPAHA